MSRSKPKTGAVAQGSRASHFRRFVLRGLGVVMPPLLTLVVFIWAWAAVESHILKPTEAALSEVLVFFTMRSSAHDEIPDNLPPEQVTILDANGQRVRAEEALNASETGTNLTATARLKGSRVDSFVLDGVPYVQVAGQKWIPRTILETVESNPGDLMLSTATAQDIYERYVRTQYLPRWRTIPVFLAAFTIILYFLGGCLASRVGHFVVASFDALIERLPLVRNVYSAVKQVTDLVFSEQEIQFNRVVAVQYPRKGIWSVGFVVSDSFQDIRAAANEPVVAVLMPTSPMPATGFIITVRKSEIFDLNITLDQAIQFIVSCGVVTPTSAPADDVTARLSAVVSHPPHGVAQLPDGATT